MTRSFITPLEILREECVYCIIMILEEPSWLREDFNQSPYEFLYTLPPSINLSRPPSLSFSLLSSLSLSVSLTVSLLLPFLLLFSPSLSSTLLSSLFSFLLLPSLLFYSSRVPLHFNCQWPLLPSALHLSLTDNKVPEVIISCGGWNNFAKVRSFSDATLSDAHAI